MNLRRKLSKGYIKKIIIRKGVGYLSSIQLKIYRITQVNDFNKFIEKKIKKAVKLTVDEHGAILHNIAKISDMGYVDLDRGAFVFREVIKELEKLQSRQKRYISTNSCNNYNNRKVVQSRIDRNGHILSNMHKELNNYYKELSKMKETNKGVSEVKETNKEVNVDDLEFYSMNIQEDATMVEIIEILNSIKFAISSEIYNELSDSTLRHFEKLEK